MTKFGILGVDSLSALLVFLYCLEPLMVFIYLSGKALSHWTVPLILLLCFIYHSGWALSHWTVPKIFLVGSNPYELAG